MSNLFFEFDLSLTKIQFPTRNQSKTTCTTSNTLFEFDLSLTKMQQPMQEYMYKVKLEFRV